MSTTINKPRFAVVSNNFYNRRFSWIGEDLDRSFFEPGDQGVTSVRNPDSLDELAKKYTSTLLVLKLDVTDKSACFEAVAKAVTRFGVVDVLINNAGYGHMGAIKELEEKEVRSQLETHVFGLLQVTVEQVSLISGDNR